LRVRLFHLEYNNNVHSLIEKRQCTVKDIKTIGNFSFLRPNFNLKWHLIRISHIFYQVKIVTQMYNEMCLQLHCGLETIVLCRYVDN